MHLVFVEELRMVAEDNFKEQESGMWRVRRPGLGTVQAAGEVPDLAARHMMRMGCTQGRREHLHHDRAA